MLALFTPPAAALRGLGGLANAVIVSELLLFSFFFLTESATIDLTSPSASKSSGSCERSSAT